MPRYVFHALEIGMRIWDLERYVNRIHQGCRPGEAYARQLQWSDAELLGWILPAREQLLFHVACGVLCVWVTNRVTPKWNPGKWKHGLKPAVPWWFYLDPYPHANMGGEDLLVLALPARKLRDGACKSCVANFVFLAGL